MSHNCWSWKIRIIFGKDIPEPVLLRGMPVADKRKKCGIIAGMVMLRDILDTFT